MSTTTEFAIFDALDLAPIKMKLMHVESGEGWSRQRADAVEADYRRFLFLMKKYPEAGASPTVDVDTFWHYHILDTMKYARDCDAAFGFFLHHYPYVGMGDGADAGARERAGARMQELYEAEFGVVVRGDAAFCAYPGKEAAAGGEPAFCAITGTGKGVSAGSATAFCAYPGQEAAADKAADKAAGKAAAFCAYPGKRAAAGGGTAFCAITGTGKGAVRGNAGAHA